MHKMNGKKWCWYILLIVGVLIQFVMIFFMATIGEAVVRKEYILSEHIFPDVIIMIGMMGVAMLTGIIRRRIAKKETTTPMPGKREENICVFLLTIITMLCVEWIVAGVSLMLLPIWFLMWALTGWQQGILARKKIQHNQEMKEYVKQYIEQLPTMQLCDCSALEKKRFSAILKQKHEGVGFRILQSVLDIGQRMGNGLIYLVIGLILCLVVYEGDMEVRDALLFLFLINVMLSSLNAIVGRKTDSLT